MVENEHLLAPSNFIRSSDVIIFGNGECARRTAANLAFQGINVVLATDTDGPPDFRSGERIKCLSGAELMACKGFAGDFNLILNQDQAEIRKTVGAIIVAASPTVSPNYEPYGLTPNDHILNITTLEETLDKHAPDAFFEENVRIAFLCGWQIDSHPSIARRMLYRCLQLQRASKVSTVFITGNLKVAETGAEKLYLQSKRAGTVFLKFTEIFPNIHFKNENQFTIAYADELIRTPFETTVDWIVVDETIGPEPGLKNLAEQLKIESDLHGFAQADNVHRLNHGTNRRGIFVAGGSRNMMSLEQEQTDADQVTLKVLAYLNEADAEPLPKVEIHRGRCARCLTCHRLCPHSAIEIEQRISIVPHACQSCGICLAGCPARAIAMQGLQLSDDLKNDAPFPYPNGERAGETPNIIVLGCGRSAGQAHELSRVMGYDLPSGVRFVEVPCGGTISSRHLLAAFDAGADGLMLLTCHTDNCKSDQGNKLASKRTQSALTSLNAAGIENERLEVSSLASNMANEFYLRINAFVDRVQALNQAVAADSAQRSEL